MKSDNTTTSLLADIGGTHVRIATTNDMGASLQSVQKYRCADYASIEEILQGYLQQCSPGTVSRACFAVAAPVSSADDMDEIVMTNIDWKFSVKELLNKFAWQQLSIINDFEAVAYAVPQLQAEQLLQLGGGTTESAGNIAVLGPGTGLGVKHIVPLDKGVKVLAGEGGHVDFAPVDDMDLSLWRFMREQNTPVAMEDVLSGRGLAQIYRAIAQAADASFAPLEAKSIIERGTAGECDLCAKSLQHFCRLLGTFAGNLALNLNTTGGVYMCGGVVSALSDYIQESDFRMRFEAKGRFRSYVQDIPVFVIAEPEPGLLGAGVYLETNA